MYLQSNCTKEKGKKTERINTGWRKEIRGKEKKKGGGGNTLPYSFTSTGHRNSSGEEKDRDAPINRRGEKRGKEDIPLPDIPVRNYRERYASPLGGCRGEGGKREGPLVSTQ